MNEIFKNYFTGCIEDFKKWRRYPLSQKEIDELYATGKLKQPTEERGKNEQLLQAPEDE